MRVRVRRTEGGWVVAERADGTNYWAPGTYPTKQAAARAAWNMRECGTPDDQAEEPPCPT